MNAIAARLLLGAAGIAAMTYAVAGVLTDAGTNPFGQVSFLVAVLIGHDLILLPIAVGIGALVVKFAPTWARGPAQGALYASAVLTFIAFPFLLGVGRSPDNPSVQPLHYGRGLLILLTAVWLVAAIIAARQWARRPHGDGGE